MTPQADATVKRVDERLSELQRATANVAPSVGFVERVLLRTQENVWSAFAVAARRSIAPLATLVVVAAIWAMTSNDAALVTYIATSSPLELDVVPGAAW